MTEEINLKALIDEVNKELEDRVNILESSYLDRCSSECAQSFVICSDIIPEFNCLNKHINSNCDCFDKEGTMVGRKNSTILVQNPQSNQTQDFSEMICLTKKLDDYFIKL